jgi:hypothetical protein
MKKIFKYRIKSVLSIALIVTTVTGCNDFFDINTDPNNPLTAQLKLLLPATETVIFEALGNGSGGMSDLTSQLVHQTVQRNTSNFYFVAGNEFNISNAWPNLYAGALQDANVMIETATGRNSFHYLGVAQVLKAYTFSQMVDLWGKASFFEFGQGTKNPFPKLDDGALIYPELFKLLNEATTNLAKTSQESVGADDVIYGGDETKWIKFANSLKLKLYNQVRNTPLYDATAVADIIANAPLMSATADGFRLLYGKTNNPENRHPLFNQDYVQSSSNYIDPYFYLIMRGDPSLPEFNPVLSGIEDPRLPYYFYDQLNDDETAQNPVTTATWGNFLSIWFASLNIDPNEGFDQGQSQTLVGLYPSGGAYNDSTGVTAGVGAGQNPGNEGEGYTRLYGYYAHLYTRAELSLTKGAPGDPRELFLQALTASFAEVNEIATLANTEFKIGMAAGEKGDDYIDAVMALYDARNAAGKLELIMTEKWIASFGYTVDAYTDYRRTGYPVMFDPATDNNPFTILNRAYPVSLPYYTSDLAIDPNAGAQRNPASDKVFWDVD